MGSILISIQPKWCEFIASGRKTLEIRNTKPKVSCPFKCYIYCTKDAKLRFWTGKTYSYADDRSHNAFDKCGNGKVIGEFVCDYVMRHCNMQNADIAEQQSLVKRENLFEYSNGKELYGWHISDLVIYDKPKELREFCKFGFENDYEAWEDLQTFGVRGIPRVEYPKEPKIDDYRIKRPPQSWCYVEELRE